MKTWRCFLQLCFSHYYGGGEQVEDKEHLQCEVIALASYVKMKSVFFAIKVALFTWLNHRGNCF